MTQTFWKHLTAGLMVCSLATGCGSEQEQLQDEKQDIQEAQEDVQQEKQDDAENGQGGAASGSERTPNGNGPAIDPDAESGDAGARADGLQPSPDHPNGAAVREEETDSLPENAGNTDN